MKIDMTTLPSGITTDEIDSWIGYFEEFKKTVPLGRIPFADELTLVFSEEIKRRNMMIRNVRAIKARIFDIWGEPGRLSTVMEEINSVTALKNAIPAISEEIAAYYKDETAEGVGRKIKGFIDSAVEIGSKLGAYVAGEYNDQSKTIVLYHKVIEKDNFRGKSFEQACEEVFIHELFHAYHSAYCRERNSIGFWNSEIVKRFDYTSTVVKESLAAAFEFRYCAYRKIATDINVDWENNPCYYPYSGARYIKEWDVFRKIMALTVDDFDMALRTMLGHNLIFFYDVKNLVVRKLVDKPKRAKSSDVPHDLKIGQYAKFVFAYLLASGKLSQKLIDKLMDKEYCKANFDINFPVLAEEGSEYFSHRRYYVDLIVGKYYICSQWFEGGRIRRDSRRKLQLWLKQNRFSKI